MTTRTKAKASRKKVSCEKLGASSATVISCPIEESSSRVAQRLPRHRPTVKRFPKSVQAIRICTTNTQRTIFPGFLFRVQPVALFAKDFGRLGY